MVVGAIHQPHDTSSQNRNVPEPTQAPSKGSCNPCITAISGGRVPSANLPKITSKYSTTSPRQADHQHDYFWHPLAGMHYHGRGSRLWLTWGPQLTTLPPAIPVTGRSEPNLSRTWLGGRHTGIYSSLTVESGPPQLPCKQPIVDVSILGALAHPPSSRCGHAHHQQTANSTVLDEPFD
ncbi:hypothetical protein OIDMADRAFT_61893 [Oidiodendron maius Zn]|uniref:Uncharacterized protein n=1 Tax=Oidiodendron maius (strain Zn) TaxID=913774 RepID=A0A0C3GRN6_OIDMZ|nr:hypothetical protein OIDMADRAFT_61893 [Oidiodendron maius Zn]